MRLDHSTDQGMAGEFPDFLIQTNTQRPVARSRLGRKTLDLRPIVKISILAKLEMKQVIIMNIYRGRKEKRF